MRDWTTSDEEKYGKLIFSQINESEEFIEYKYKHPKFIDNQPGISFRNIGLSIMEGEKIIRLFPIHVYRAPIVLIHGLNSSNATFSHIKNEIYKTYKYEYNLITRANYESTNRDAFIENRFVLPTSIYKVLKKSRELNIAAGKVDVVGHSMGGILTRLYLQSDNYQDDILRIITLNTPHSGSHIANASKDPEIRKLLSVLGPIKSGGIFYFLNSLQDGAVGDLQVDSDAIRNDLNGVNLNRNIVPIHSITSHDRMDLNDIPETQLEFSLFHREIIAPYITAFVLYKENELANATNLFFTKIFDTELYDYAVSLPSQKALTNNNNITIIENQPHSSTENEDVVSKVISLLLENPNSSSFSHTGYTPETLTYSSPFVENSSNSITNNLNDINISINSPENGAVLTSESNINISVSGDNAIEEIVLLMDYNKDSTQFAKVNNSNLSFNFSMDNVGGERNIIAIGKTTNGEIAVDSVKIFVCPENLTLGYDELKNGRYFANNNISSSGYIEDESEVILQAGNTITLMPGFQTENGINFTAKIESCGASMLLKERNKTFKLSKEKENFDIQNIFSFSVSPNPFSQTTTINLSIPTQQDISITLHDFNGRQIKQITNQRMAKGNHNLPLDATNLTPGFYYLTLESPAETITRKIVVGRQ